MIRLYHPQRPGRWSRVLILLAVLAALANVRPAQATARIRLVRDINAVTTRSSSADFLTVTGNMIFFVAIDGVHGWELWKSDGTATGTSLVKDINLNGSSDPSSLTAVGSTLFFAADDGVHGRELWTSDGTAAGTSLVKDINLNGSSDPSSPTAVGSTLFFAADDGVHGRELWMSDGTTAGTTMVKDIIHAGGSGLRLYENTSLTAVGSTLFFAADDGVHGRELWTSDGTPGGTRLVQDLDPGAASADPSYFTRIGTTVFFSATTRATSRELWAMEYYQLYLPLTHR